jgi:hypothetical protein
MISPLAACRYYVSAAAACRRRARRESENRAISAVVSIGSALVAAHFAYNHSAVCVCVGISSSRASGMREWRRCGDNQVMAMVAALAVAHEKSGVEA